MKKTIAILLLLTSLIQISFALSPSDINNHWAKTYINRLVTYRIINGYPDGTFKPNHTMTRAEFVKLLIASMQYDVKAEEGAWYLPYFKTAKAKNILTPDLAYLEKAPNMPIERIEAIRLINRLVEAELDVSKIALKTPQFKDFKSTLAVQRSYSLNMIMGYPDGTLKPNHTLKRGEVAKILSIAFFGERDSHNDLITLPVFEVYIKTFDTVNTQRYTTLKSGKTPHATHQKQMGIVVEGIGIDDFYQAYQSATDKVMVDIRSAQNFTYVHVMGSKNSQLEDLEKTNGDALFLIVDHALNENALYPLKQSFKFIYIYQIQAKDYAKNAPTYPSFEGSFKKESSTLPDYLNKRFDEVAKAYHLTWTDADFKNWWENASDAEKDKYLFPSYRRSVPVFDWQNKKVMLSNNAKRSDGKTPINPQDPAMYTLGLKDMAYISYEILKRNVEYLMKDGADWGRINVSYMDDMSKRGIFVEVIDFIGSGAYQSFQMMVSGSDAIRRSKQFGYWLQDQIDQSLILNQDKVTVRYHDYILKNTKLNMQLLHGVEMGQQVYDNYMKGYTFTFEHRYNELDTRFNTTIEGYKVEHIFANGYQILYKK